MMGAENRLSTPWGGSAGNNNAYASCICIAWVGPLVASGYYYNRVLYFLV